MTKKVKKNLQTVSANLLKALDTRLKTPPFFTAAFAAFESCETWYPTEKLTDEDQINVLREKLNNLINEMSGSRKEYFLSCFDDVLDGYNIFLEQHCSKQKTQKGITLEESYASYWELFHEIPAAKHFIKLFEFVQVKSYS